MNSWKLLEASSKTWKQSAEHKVLQCRESSHQEMRSLTFSNICRILDIVTPYVQQIVSMFWITPPIVCKTIPANY